MQAAQHRADAHVCCGTQSQYASVGRLAACMTAMMPPEVLSSQSGLTLWNRRRLANPASVVRCLPVCKFGLSIRSDEFETRSQLCRSARHPCRSFATSLSCLRASTKGVAIRSSACRKSTRLAVARCRQSIPSPLRLASICVGNEHESSRRASKPAQAALRQPGAKVNG